MTTAPRYAASSFSLRATALGLAALVSLALLAGVGATADRQYDQALAQQEAADSAVQMARQAVTLRAPGA